MNDSAQRRELETADDSLVPVSFRFRAVAIACFVYLTLAPGPCVFAQSRAAILGFPVVQTADVQPLLVNVGQITDTLEFLGAPLAAADQDSLRRAAGPMDRNAITRAVQAALDPYCLVMVHLNPESRVKLEVGPAARRLVQHGWSPFLVKIHNEAGWTGALGVSSPQAGAVFDKEYCAPWSDTNPINGPAMPVRPDEAAARMRDRWLDLEVCVQRPMNSQLHGIGLEYAIVCLRPRDAGRRTAVIGFDIGQGTQDLGFRGELALTFECAPAVEVKLGVKDEQGRPATGAFVIRDRSNRVYPSPYKRLAPDFFFQPHVYRADGESLALAAGDYVIEFSRGPESVLETRRVTIGTKPTRLDFQVRRWVDPAAFGYVAGDHHIHGAGCAHYTTPSLGVGPADMARQIRGEGLQVGAVLTWGPGYESQHALFTGRDDPVSDDSHRLRYDVEVSGFGSYRTGHLCLLRLKDQHYPGSRGLEVWPTLGLSILKWAKRQGAITGSPHSGGGYQLAGDRTNNTAVYATNIPFLDTPSFDGTGAVEFLVNITHEVPGPEGRPVPAVDIISTGNTPFVAELTVWYHTLNCGFRPRAAGESDFPCLNGDRVGHCRSYVRVPGDLSYDTWCEALAEGRSYVSEGHSHLIDFRIGDTRAGEKGGEVRLAAPGPVKARVKVAALLDAAPRQETLAWPMGRSQTELNLPPTALQPVAKPPFENRTRPWYWHIERARVAGTRRVPVELIVNGEAVARREVEADGVLRDLEFDATIARSSWVAVRILGSSHSNPVFVLVEDRPIRASRRSAAWCLAGVDGVWNRKSRFYAEDEIAEARAAYDHARGVYRKILAESSVD